MILPKRVYDLGLSHKAVAVYIYLCNRSDRNGECFPSVGRIANDLSLSRSTIYRALKELEINSMLQRRKRYMYHGGRSSTLYHLKGEIGSDKHKKRGGVNV